MFKVQVQSFGTGTRYGLEILQKCGKGVETKSHKAFGANSYVCRSYMEKTCRGLFASPFLDRAKVKQAQRGRVNQFIFQNVQNNEIFEISKKFKNNC